MATAPKHFLSRWSARNSTLWPACAEHPGRSGERRARLARYSAIAARQAGGRADRLNHRARGPERCRGPRHGENRLPDRALPGSCRTRQSPLMAYKDDVPILAAPGCFRSLKPNVVDLLMPPLMARYRVSTWELACLGTAACSVKPPQFPAAYALTTPRRRSSSRICAADSNCTASIPTFFAASTYSAISSVKKHSPASHCAASMAFR